MSLANVPDDVKRRIYGYGTVAPEKDARCNKDRACQLAEEQKHKNDHPQCEGYCNALFSRARASAERDWPPLSGLHALVGPLEEHRGLYLHPEIIKALLRQWKDRDDARLVVLWPARIAPIIAALCADPFFMRGYLWVVRPDLSELLGSPLLGNRAFVASLFDDDAHSADYHTVSFDYASDGPDGRARLASRLFLADIPPDSPIARAAFYTQDEHMHRQIMARAVRIDGRALQYARPDILAGDAGLEILVAAALETDEALPFVPLQRRDEVFGGMLEALENNLDLLPPPDVNLFE